MRPCVFPLFAIIFGISAASIEPASGKDVDGILDPSRIGWSAFQIEASKLFVSVKAIVTIGDIDKPSLQEILIDPGEGTGTDAGAATKELKLATDFVGRHSDMNLFLNAQSGAALQRISHDSGGRLRHRIYRFTDLGAYQKSWWPVGTAEEKLPADRWPEWSERSEYLRPYPDPAVGGLVTEPAGLLYIIGAARLNEPGDKFEILAYIRGHVHRVHIEVLGKEDISLNFDEWQGTSRTKRKGSIQAIKLMIRGEAIAGQEEEFEMLGLRGDITMHLDPDTRAPLQLAGKVKVLGQVTMRIHRLIRPAPGN